jgi:hypothetical protein
LLISFLVPPSTGDWLLSISFSSKSPASYILTISSPCSFFLPIILLPAYIFPSATFPPSFEVSVALAILA